MTDQEITAQLEFVQAGRARWRVLFQGREACTVLTNLAGPKYTVMDPRGTTWEVEDDEGLPGRLAWVVRTQLNPG